MKRSTPAAVLRRLLLDLLLKLPGAILIYLWLFSIAGYLGTLHQFLELTSHFRLQYLVLALCCTVVLALLRRWRWVAAGLCCVLVNGAAIIPYYLPGASAQADRPGHGLRLLLSNVLFENTHYSALVDLVKAEKPDLLVLQEVTDDWLREVRVLSEVLPYAQPQPAQGITGIALFSRFPLEESSVLSLGSEDHPSITARISVGGQTIHLLTTHPAPPVDGDYTGRNEQLRAVASFIRDLPRPAIVIGDLNTSPWSPYYSQFVREAGLADTRKGFGVLPTWPVFWPLMMIPIDHCLVSADIKTVRVRTGWDIGSDHLPLIVDLVIPNSKN